MLSTARSHVSLTWKFRDLVDGTRATNRNDISRELRTRVLRSLAISIIVIVEVLKHPDSHWGGLGTGGL